MKKLGEKVVKEMKSAIDELEFVSLQHSIQQIIEAMVKQIEIIVKELVKKPGLPARDTATAGT